MIGATSRHIKKVPFKLVSMTTFHSGPSEILDALGVETAAGDVRKHVDAAEALHRLCHRRLDFARHRHVERKGSGLTAGFFDLGAHLLCRGVLAIRHDDGHSARGHSLRYRPADAVSATCDQCHWIQSWTSLGGDK